MLRHGWNEDCRSSIILQEETMALRGSTMEAKMLKNTNRIGRATNSNHLNGSSVFPLKSEEASEDHRFDSPER